MFNQYEKVHLVLKRTKLQAFERKSEQAIMYNLKYWLIKYNILNINYHIKEVLRRINFWLVRVGLFELIREINEFDIRKSDSGVSGGECIYCLEKSKGNTL